MTPVRTMPIARRAFSLVELITVILIISIIIAIIVPALGGARDAARRTSATALNNDILTAATAFRRDNGDSLPGYFTPTEMGSDQNGNVPDQGGLTAMENLLLDLAMPADALRTQATLPAADAAAYIPVFPGDPTSNLADAAFVNPDLIGSGSYLQLPATVLVPQVRDIGQEASLPIAAAEGVRQMPDIVDPWGQPVLAWVADTGRVASVRTRTDFARRSSNTGRALFYWNSNAGYLRARAYGRKATDMTVAPTYSTPTSLIGLGAANGVASEDNFADYLGAFLGSPAYPSEGSLTGGSPFTDPFALRGRGEIIIHSSGQDGIPFAANSPQARSAEALMGSTPTIRYGINFATPNGTRRSDGSTTITEDIASTFDDILTTSN